MPIVNTITLETPNSDGSKHVVVRSYDQEGKEYMYSFYAAPGVNVQTVIDVRVAMMNEQLAQAEFEQLVGAA